MTQPPLSKLHPAARLSLLASTLVALTAVNDPLYVAPIAAAVGVAALLACGAARAWVRTLPLVGAFVVLSLLLWPPFIREGSPWLGFGFYRATTEGARYGLAVGLRITAMLWAGVAFLAVTTPEEFAEALRTFRLPAPLVVTLSLSFRLLPVMFETTGRALEAQRARGMDFGRGFFSQARQVIPLIVPVFLYSLRSADQLAVALELRGYRAGIRPAPLHAAKVTFTDYALPILGWFAVAAVVIIRLLGFGASLPHRL